MSDSMRLAQKSIELSKMSSAESLFTGPTFAPKRSLKGLIQRWRDSLAENYDEGIQFILEDNLLNFLLVEDELSESYPTSQWLLFKIQSFYTESSLKTAYVPYHISVHLEELLGLFQSKSSHPKPRSHLMSTDA